MVTLSNQSFGVSVVLKFAVAVVLGQTILLPDLIVPTPHFCFPLLMFHLSHVCLPFQPLLLSSVSLGGSTGAAAAVDTDAESEEDDPSHHRHGDDQGLEVHPADAPSGLRKGTEAGRRQDPPHWVIYTRPSALTPQTRYILQTLSTACVGL